MNDFDTRLRASLTRAAEGAPRPHPFADETVGRIRTRRGLKGAGLVAAVLVAVAGGAAALRPTNETPPPADHSENTGPYTHWLYVLDPGVLSEKTQVLALDPDTRKVVRAFPAGYDPQMALSPDGSRLYVTSSVERFNAFSSAIDVFDTSTGERIERASLPELNGTFVSRTLHKGPVSAPDFVTSPDGGRIYLGESTVRRGPVRATARVGTFDTKTSELLPNAVEIKDCDTRVFLPGTSPAALTVVCSRSNNHPTVPAKNFVYFMTIADDGSASDFERVDLPDRKEGELPYGNLAWAASADGETIYAVTRDGHVFVIDAGTRRLEREADLLGHPGFSVQIPKVLLSPDGGTMYLGIGFSSGSTVDARWIDVYDTQTWDEVDTVMADRLFFGLALGPGGSKLYAPTWEFPERPSRGRATLQVFDALTLEPLGTIGSVGETPALVEVPRLGR